MHSKEIIITHTTIFDDGGCYIRSREVIDLENMNKFSRHFRDCFCKLM